MKWAELTEKGYLRQPHTSAGRVPTEEGYRYFVSQMIDQAKLPESVQHTILHQFDQTTSDVEQWMHLAASVLAHQSQGAALITAPRSEKARFQHVELISTQGRQILMVLVIVGGEVTQQLLTLAEPVSQERLSQTAAHLNRLLMGRPMDEIENVPRHSDALEQDILTLISQDYHRLAETVSGTIYTDGLTNVLSEPEFADSDEARRALDFWKSVPLCRTCLPARLLTAHPAGCKC